MPLPLNDTKDLLYIKVRSLIVKYPCGLYNYETGVFVEFASDMINHIYCPNCKTEIFHYDCLLEGFVISSMNIHYLRYHRHLISQDILLKLRQITGVVD